MSVNRASESRTVVRTVDDDVCRAVISAVAEARGVRPIDLDVPLFEAVDPDALQRLFPGDGRTSAARLEFVWAGCLVAVDGGRVAAVRTGPQ